MTHNLPEWAYLMGESGRCWQRLSQPRTERSPDDGSERPPARAVYAIASCDIISSPQWVNSRDSEIVSQVLRIESEKLGLNRNGGPGKVSDWKQIEISGSQCLVQSLSIPWPLDDLRRNGTDFTSFLPQYSLYPPPADAIVLWREDDHWVIGYSRGPNWVHLQTYLEEDSKVKIAREVSLTLLELDAKNIVSSPGQIAVWDTYDQNLHELLEQEVGIPVTFDQTPIPGEKPAWKFEPHEVSLAKLAKRARKRSLVYTLAGVVFFAALAAIGFADLWLLSKSNTRLETRVSGNREAAAAIEDSIEKWQALSPALDTRRSPLELFHQVSQLLPAEGLRLTSFEIQNFRTVILRGEGSTMANALQFKGALERAEGLSDYKWEVPQPANQDNLTSFFATGTYRY